MSKEIFEKLLDRTEELHSQAFWTPEVEAVQLGIFKDRRVNIVIIRNPIVIKFEKYKLETEKRKEICELYEEYRKEDPKGFREYYPSPKEKCRIMEIYIKRNPSMEMPNVLDEDIKFVDDLWMKYEMQGVFVCVFRHDARHNDEKADSKIINHDGFLGWYTESESIKNVVIKKLSELFNELVDSLDVSPGKKKLIKKLEENWDKEER